MPRDPQDFLQAIRDEGVPLTVWRVTCTRCFATTLREATAPRPTHCHNCLAPVHGATTISGVLTRP